MLLVLATVAAVLATSSPAAVVLGPPQPTITGEPVVGGTLTSSDVGESTTYQWQRCDPSASACNSVDSVDSSWSDIAGASAQSYMVAPADTGFFIRVLAMSPSTAEQWVASDRVGPISGAQGAPAGVALAPEHGVQVLAEPVFGTVEVKTPGGSFQALTGLTELPVGTIFDTRGSRVRLTAATGAFGSTAPDQSVEFYAGLFKIKQSPGSGSDATAKLIGKLACGAGRPTTARAGSKGPTAVTTAKRGRKLWGSGSGGYATSGRGSTSSVRGTIWLTKDTCDGTLTKVVEGLGVEVFDRKLKKKIFLGPGEKYLARL